MSEHRNDMPKTPQKPQAPKEWLKGEIIRAEVQRKAEEEAANLARLKAEAGASSGQRRGDKDAETRQRFVEDCAEAGQKGSGILFNALCRGQLIFVPEWDSWLEWKGQFWFRIWPFEAASRVGIITIYTPSNSWKSGIIALPCTFPVPQEQNDSQKHK